MNSRHLWIYLRALCLLVSQGKTSNHIAFIIVAHLHHTDTRDLLWLFINEKVGSICLKMDVAKFNVYIILSHHCMIIIDQSDCFWIPLLTFASDQNLSQIWLVRNMHFHICCDSKLNRFILLVFKSPGSSEGPVCLMHYSNYCNFVVWVQWYIHMALEFHMLFGC